jgi:SanA protein
VQIKSPAKAGTTNPARRRNSNSAPMGRLIQKLKQYRRTAIVAGLLALIAPVPALNLWVLQSSSSRVFTDDRDLPQNDVALVLGVSRFGNLHFKARTEAAARLYHAGKIRHLLLSGDNHVAGYDEPSDMKEAVLMLGVPESAVTLDYAGFRTLDSVVRAREVFGQHKLTIVTDEFHAYRAVFLARHYDIEAVAFCSAEVPLRWSAEARVREYGARVKANIFILNRGPRFLGPPVEIKT